MIKRLQEYAVTVAALSLFAGSTVALAQAGRAWVDPPQEGATPVPTEQPGGANEETVSYPPVPSANQATSPKAPIQDEEREPAESVGRAAEPEGSKETAKSGKQAAPPNEADRSALSAQTGSDRKPPIRRSDKSAVKSKSAVGSTSASAAKSRRSTVVARDAVRAPAARARGRHFDTVQEALDAGYEVMRLQTIQLPDGRRVQRLVRPESPDIEGAMSWPY